MVFGIAAEAFHPAGGDVNDDEFLSVMSLCSRKSQIHRCSQGSETSIPGP